LLYIPDSWTFGKFLDIEYLQFLKKRKYGVKGSLGFIDGTLRGAF
jgi:hypothetical protein